MPNKVAPTEARFFWQIKRMLAVCLGLGIGLTGCMGVHPVTDTATRAMGWQAKAPEFVPGVTYMRVTVNGRHTWMALGEHAQEDDGLHTHWYSGQGEMLHLRDGRLVEALGLTHELRAQRGVVPSWSTLVQAQHPVVWRRERDAMPGYRYGMTEHITSQRCTPTAQQEQRVGPGALWVVEKVRNSMGQAPAWHYQELFAVRNQQVVYSEQCLSPQLCLALQPVGVVQP